jgi:hypothetical protein
MRWTKISLLGLLTMYSIALLYAELKFSQDYVRNYFTDITGPVRFYAINTTISIFLLWGTALIFAISTLCIDEEDDGNKARIFYTSQVLLFSYLGLDDRFMLHEWLASAARINDALIIFGLGILEIGLLIYFGDLKKNDRDASSYIFLRRLCSSPECFL